MMFNKIFGGKPKKNHVRPEPKSVLVILSLILFFIILTSSFNGADAGRRGGGGSWGRGSRYIFETYFISTLIRESISQSPGLVFKPFTLKFQSRKRK